MDDDSQLSLGYHDRHSPPSAGRATWANHMDARDERLHETPRAPKVDRATPRPQDKMTRGSR